MPTTENELNNRVNQSHVRGFLPDLPGYEPGISTLLTEIKPSTIVRRYRRRDPSAPYPLSEFFYRRTEHDTMKTTDRVQASLVRGIPIDWRLIPSDTVREVVINACKESVDRFDFNRPFSFLGGHRLQDLEKHVREKTGDDTRDVSFLLLADLSLLPPQGQLVVFFQKMIDEKRSLPSYPQLQNQFGVSVSAITKIIKEAGLQEKFRKLKTESSEITLPQSEEAAWVLGMLLGTSGGYDPTRGIVSFTNSDDKYRLPAFKASAEKVFGEIIPGAKAKVGMLHTNSINPAVYFNNKTLIDVLGDFHRKEKPDTIRERFGWVLDAQYVRSFASGVFDSGGRITDTLTSRQIEFLTTDQVFADFYHVMFLRLGITGSRIITVPPHENVIAVRIQNIKDIRTFAENTQSVDPQTQQQLDLLQTATKRTRRITRKSTPQDVITEGLRLTNVLGHVPKAQEIAALRAQGEDTFPVSAYIAALGRSPDGRSTWSHAMQRLGSFIGKTDDEIRDQVSAITVYTGRRKYADQEIIDEYKRVRDVEMKGRIPTVREYYELYRAGRTSVPVNQLIRYMGGTYKVAIRTLEDKLSETNESRVKQVYP